MFLSSHWSQFGILKVQITIICRLQLKSPSRIWYSTRIRHVWWLSPNYPIFSILNILRCSFLEGQEEVAVKEVMEGLERKTHSSMTHTYLTHALISKSRLKGKSSPNTESINIQLSKSRKRWTDLKIMSYYRFLSLKAVVSKQENYPCLSMIWNWYQTNYKAIKPKLGFL